MADITYCRHYCDNLDCFRNKEHVKPGEKVSWSFFCGCEDFKKVKEFPCDTEMLDNLAKLEEFKKHYICEWIGGK